MQRAGLALGGALVAMCLASCGGSGSHKYTLSATRSCLEKAGFETSVVANQYLRASGGSLRVHFNVGPGLLAPNQPHTTAPGYAFLVFGKDPAEALAVENRALTLAVQSFEHQPILVTRATIKKGVGLTKNVFYYSTTGALTRSEREKIVSCLR